MGINMNTSSTEKKFEEAIKEFPKAMEKTTKEYVQMIFEETQFLVPKKTLALMNSGKITGSSHGSNFRMSISYGDEDVNYAAAVHEILKASHAPPTQAKYVEEPLFASIPAGKRKFVEDARKVKAVIFK